MNVREINDGLKASYVQADTNLVISVNAQSINIDMQAAQKDTEQVLDISLDSGHNLVQGVDQWYVANVIIPPEKTVIVDTGEVDPDGNPIMRKDTLPLNPEEVGLVLWALPNLTQATEGGTI